MTAMVIWVGYATQFMAHLPQKKLALSYDALGIQVSSKASFPTVTGRRGCAINMAVALSATTGHVPFKPPFPNA